MSKKPSPSPAYHLLFKKQCHAFPLTLIQRILYNLRDYNDIAHIISNSELNCEQQRYMVTEILRNTTNPANILASRSHNGSKWMKKSVDKIIKWLENQFRWWRGLELAVCEAMLRQEEGSVFHRKNGVSFLPAHELDTECKIDMISRIPIVHPEKPIRTIAFGTQITITKIYDENGIKTETFQQKYDQIKSIVPILHTKHTQQEIIEKYGPISTPNIICLMAINGRLWEVFAQNTRYAETKFHEWKREGFQSQWILDFFKNKYKNDLLMIAQTLQETQCFIITPQFLCDIQEDFSHTEDKNDGYTKTVQFCKKTNELELTLKKDGHMLMHTIFFVTQDDITRLQRMHT